MAQAPSSPRSASVDPMLPLASDSDAEADAGTMREEAPTQLQRTCVRRSLVGSSPAPNPFHHADSNTAQPQMDSGQEYPLQESGVEWTPSNLNLSANGQMIAEARAEGFTWSPSYLNIMSSNESCCCLSGAREVESPDKYGNPKDLDLTLAFLKEAVSVKGDYFINTAYQPQIQGQNEGIATYHVTCHCTGPTSTKDERWDTETQPVEIGPKAELSPSVGLRGAVVGLEEVYVWEAKSYAGSEDSNKLEELRRAGKAPIPMGPGERSEEELGILPKQLYKDQHPQISDQIGEERPAPKKCPCAIGPKDTRLAQPLQVSEISHAVEAGEVIDPEHAVGIEKTVAALEDVYVWEAKSYAGSEDSDKMEMLRRAGKAPIPLGPGERSEEELGIAPRSMQPTLQQMGTFSGTRESPPKKKCCCAVPLAEPSHQISEISHTVQVGEVIDPEHAVGIEKAVAALEDVYVWEAKSYAGSEDSDKMEMLRRAGKAPIPLGPGERSEEELGIAPRSMQPTPQQIDAFSGTGISPPPKKVCCCSVPLAEPSQQISEISHTVQVGEIIDPEHAVEMEKAVVALEDVYVWEAKSYAGSEDSDKMEELRRAGKAPIPLGPGERSEEELGIAPRSMQPIPQQMDTFSGTGTSPPTKKVCCCAAPRAEPSQQVSQISHTVEVGEIIDPEHAVGMEKAVAALEDVYVWEAKSYAGSEDSDKMEELRRAGKAPIPLGPGERSEEELGIAPRSMQPIPQQMDTFSGTGTSPPTKKVCCCAAPRAEPSQQVSQISHTVEVGEIIDPEHAVGMEKAVAALEDVYVWEAKSYAGSEDSNKMEELRRAGKAPIPLGPGERSEEELGIAPRSMQPTPQQIDAFSGTGTSPPTKKVCCCAAPRAEPSQQVSQISHTVEVGEIIDPEHAVGMEKAVAALEDVYVWEAKSYAGSEDSNKMEELRRAGKAPIPLGPGERSEEELGIAPRSMQPTAQQIDAFSGTGISPAPKKPCCCAAPRAEPSQQVSEIPHTVEVGQVIDPEHTVGMEKAVAALEDVYVWEAKSYAGSEDSNKMEELRRAGKAPIPLGPGERSEEELGIAPRSMQPIPQQMDTFSGTGISPSRKKPCCCATALAHPSQQVSEISHPVEVGQVIDPEHAVGVEKAVAALEDVYVWEAKSYAGSEDSDKMEVLRRAGKAPIPLGPGERSEEELGIAPRSPLTVTQQLFESDISLHAKKCTCEIRHPADPTQDGREHIPVESVQIIDSRTAVGMKKSVSALEDVYVWEAKSYAGSEDSNKMEELRRAGKAPIPLGPGERSEEELGISTYRALAPSPETEGTIPSSSLGAIPSTKKKCPCRRNQTRSQKTGDIVHHAPEVGQIMDPETTVGIEKAVAALEDVYVWEAKSYAGSEDSNRLEELRRAGKAPLPLGPGERSEEELGIRTVTLGLDQPYGDQSTLKTKCPCEKRLKGGGGCDKPNCDCPNPCEQIEIQNTQCAVPQNVLDRPVSEMSALCPRKTAGKCVKRSCRSEKQRMGPAGIAESHLPEKQDFVVQAKSAGLGERKKPCPCKSRKDAKTTNKDEPRVEKRNACHCFLSPSQIDIHAAPDSCICKHCKKKRDKLAIQMGGAPPMPQWDYQLSYAQDQHDGPSVLDVYHHPPDGDESVDTLCMQFPESAVGVTSRSAAGIPDTAESTQSNLPWGNFCVANRKPPDLTFPSYAETAASADIEWQMQTCTCKPSVTERIEFLTHLLQQGISPLRDSLRELQLKIRDLGIPEFAELEKDSIGDICTCCPYTSPCAQLDAIDTFSQGPFKGPMPCPCVGIYIFPNDGQKSNGIDGPSEITDAAALPFVEQIDYTACTHCSHKYPPDAPISSSYIPPETSSSSPETPISPPGTSHSPPRTPEDFTKKYGLTSAVCTDEEITDSDNEKKPCCHAFRKRKTKSNR